jgi:hypothetical protein
MSKFGGWPSFLNARAMPDGKVAVAIESGSEIFVGVLSLRGMDIRYSLQSNRIDGDKPISIKAIVDGDRFISVSQEDYDELSYHRKIPQYAHIPVLEDKSNATT